MSDNILPRLKCVTHDQEKTMENKKKKDMTRWCKIILENKI